MNCSIGNKKMSFEKFVEKVGEHFKASRDPMKAMQEIYERETGKNVTNRKLSNSSKGTRKEGKNKKDKANN